LLKEIFKMPKTIICSFLTILASGVVSASAIVGVCGTGFTNGACGTEGVVGSIDGNWALTSSAETIVGTNAYITHSGQFPIPPWLADTSTGQWIGPQVGGSETNDAPGLYVYTETFNLALYNLSTVVLTGAFAADNSAEIFLNGVDTGIGTSAFSSLTALNITSGFLQGVNTLTIDVTNGPGATGNPSGLFVELSGTGAGTAIPEPASLAFMGFGLAVLGFFGRRLRS
jgi:hypothetical protein